MSDERSPGVVLRSSDGLRLELHRPLPVFPRGRRLTQLADDRRSGVASAWELVISGPSARNPRSGSALQLVRARRRSSNHPATPMLVPLAVSGVWAVVDRRATETKKAGEELL